MRAGGEERGRRPRKLLSLRPWLPQAQVVMMTEVKTWMQETERPERRGSLRSGRPSLQGSPQLLPGSWEGRGGPGALSRACPLVNHAAFWAPDHSPGGTGLADTVGRQWGSCALWA